MSCAHRYTGPGRIEFRADDEALTPYAGLALVGELARRTGLIELVDAELACERRAAAIKRRRRGVSGGELVVSLAEQELVGGECFDHVEELRADGAGAALRAVAQVPSAPTALQLAKRFRRSLCQAVERGLARAGQRLDRALGRDPSEPVTIDLDAQVIEVYGRKARRLAQPLRTALVCPAYRLLGRARPRPDRRARRRPKGEAASRGGRHGLPARTAPATGRPRLGHLPDRLRLLRARAASRAARQGRPLHGLGPAHERDVGRARADP